MLLSELHPEHSDLIAFGDHCIWAWECHQVAKQYCDDPGIVGWCDIDAHLAVILKEYALLQIAKIHDPAKTCGYDNHSMRQYCERYDCDYEALMADCAVFVESVAEARKKTIAHSDLVAMREGSLLGSFEDGDDARYFSVLHSAVNVLYDKAGIGPFPDWPTFITHDVSASIEKMRRLTSCSSGRADVRHST